MTKTREVRAYFGAPGAVVYLGDDGLLRRMRDDGSGAEIVSPDPIVYLKSVSPDGRWAAVIAAASAEEGATRVELWSLDGGASIEVCDETCRGIGPANARYDLPFYWSLEGTRFVVNAMFLGSEAPEVVLLPYRSDTPLEKLWPAGLATAEAVKANPGAKVIAASNVFLTADPAAYLTWQPSFQSNLYRIRLPQ